MNFRFLIILLVALSIPANTLLAKDNTQLKKIIKKNSSVSQDEKKNEDKSEKKAPALFLGVVGYSVTSDYADESSPRLYNHNIFTHLSLNILPYQIRSTIKAGLDFDTLGSSIYENNQDSNGFHPTDSILLFSKTFDLNPSLSSMLSNKKEVIGKHNLNTMILNIFPTSDSSRYAGYKSSHGAQMALSSSFFDGTYSLTNGANFIKVINTYSHNPASGKISPSYMSTFAQTHTLNLLYGFSIDAGFSFKTTKDVEGNSNTSFANSAGINYTYAFVSASISYSGGDHVNNDKVELWYVDNTRRLITFSLVINF